MKKADAWSDGSNSKPNGFAAAVLKLEDGTVIERTRKLGDVSNMVAEYRGVILALAVAIEYEVTDLRMHTDNETVAHHLNGVYKVRKGEMRSLYGNVVALASSLNSVSIQWISREENEHADSLCRQQIKLMRRKSKRPKPPSRPRPGGSLPEKENPFLPSRRSAP